MALAAFAVQHVIWLCLHSRVKIQCSVAKTGVLDHRHVFACGNVETYSSWCWAMLLSFRTRLFLILSWIAIARNVRMRVEAVLFDLFNTLVLLEGFWLWTDITNWCWKKRLYLIGCLHCLFGNQLAPQFFGGGSTPTSTAPSCHMEWGLLASSCGDSNVDLTRWSR
jgi:hypothetical protein